MKGKWFIIISIIGILVITGLSLGLYFTFKPSPAVGITITDDLGRTVYIDGIPQRIVSHVPSITETIFALGLGEKVVGVSDHCDYPEAAKLKPKVGGFFNPSIETIVDLNPDLVLTNGSIEYLVTQLDNLGITFVVLQPKVLGDILRNIELLGKVTGTEKKAEKLIKDMQADVSHIVARVKDAPRVKVFYLFASIDLNNPWTAGPGSFVDSLITMAGGDNIAAKALGAWVQFSIEEVVNSDPEIIIVDTRMGTAVISPVELKKHPAWQGTTAVKQDRVFIIDGDLVNRSGPRIVQGLKEMAKIIHPELFE